MSESLSDYVDKLERGMDRLDKKSNLDPSTVKDENVEIDELDENIIKHPSKRAVDPTEFDHEELLEEGNETDDNDTSINSTGNYDEELIFSVSEKFEPFKEEQDLEILVEYVDDVLVESKDRDDAIENIADNYDNGGAKIDQFVESGVLDSSYRPNTPTMEIIDLADDLQTLFNEYEAEAINNDAKSSLENIEQQAGLENGALTDNYDGLSANDAAGNGLTRAAQTIRQVSKRQFTNRPEHKMQVLMELGDGPATAEELKENTTYSTSDHASAAANLLMEGEMVDVTEDNEYELTEIGERVEETVSALYGIEETTRYLDNR